MGKSNKSQYLKTKHVGVFKYLPTGTYQARKKIKGRNYRKTFNKIRDAIQWHSTFNGVISVVTGHTINAKSSTLAYVWDRYLKLSAIRVQSKDKLIQQYELLKELEHFHMHEITPTLISEWLILKVEEFKKAQSLGKGSGIQARCSLKNELKVLKQIFNWYKEESEFDLESAMISQPVKKRHFKQGFIKKPKKKEKKIKPHEVIAFFNELKQPFRDLAIIQYYCAGRIGETIGIQKESIDFKNKTLHIGHTAIHDRNKKFRFLSDLTKTGEDRTVYITDSLRKALLSRLNDSSNRCNFLTQLNGKPLNYGTVLGAYNRAFKKLGFPYTGTHCLRHGCASLARTLTGSLDAAMSVTGHRDARVAEIYAEFSDSVQINTSLQIEEHLKSLKVSGENTDFRLIH